MTIFLWSESYHIIEKKSEQIELNNIGFLISENKYCAFFEFLHFCTWVRLICSFLFQKHPIMSFTVLSQFHLDFL